MRLLGMAAIAAVMVAGPAWAQKTARFNVGGVAMEVTLPEGYCVPDGQLGEVVKALAAADPANVTHVMFAKCGDTDFSSDYYAIKTPRELVNTTLDRASFLKSLEPYFGKAGADPFPQATDVAADSLSKVTGERVEMEGSVKALGMDAQCGYLGGIIKMSASRGDYSGVVAGCITVIGGRAIAIYSSGRGDKPADVTRHVQAARALLPKIVPVKR